MGNKQTVLEKKGYTVVNEQEKMMLVKNEVGDLFIVKKLKADQDNESNFLLELNHPHIVEHKEIIKDGDCLYLVLEHCAGGDLAQKIKDKIEAADTFSENEILDWTVKICTALKYLHDQQIPHKNLQPKVLFFTACGTIRLGEFGQINERCTAEQTAETEALTHVAPEILSGKPCDGNSDLWSLGCVIYEMCMLKCAFTGRSTVDTVTKILTCFYEALPETFSEDLRQLVTDTLQIDPENRPSVSEILMRSFIVKHLYEKSTQTMEELYKALFVLKSLADGLERVHFNTTVSSLTGGVIGLAGGITSVVGAILAPFTLGASLIVTGVGIGVSVAGGVTAGVSNITKMVNERSDRQKIKMIIKEMQEKITSTICCIQNIQIAVESNKSLSNAQFRDNANAGETSQPSTLVNAGTRLGRGLGGIPELVRLTQVASVGKVAAQTARVGRVAEAATGVLSGLFVAVDIFFIALDSKEIHNLRKDYASRKSKSTQTPWSTETQQESKSTQTPWSTETQQESKNAETDTESKITLNPESTETQQESKNAETDTDSKITLTPQSTECKPQDSDTKMHPSTNKKEQELRSEIMKFVEKIRETTAELQNILDELKDELQSLKPEIPNTDDDLQSLKSEMPNTDDEFQNLKLEIPNTDN